MQSVSPRMWRILIAALTLTIIVGIVSIAALWTGWANPLRDELVILSETGSASPPFTLETNRYLAFTLICGDSPALHFALRGDGYYSVTEQPEPDWKEFIHIKHTDNTLYLRVNINGEAVFRINEEIAWIGMLNRGICFFTPFQD